jgi:hypothetical protein
MHSLRYRIAAHAPNAANRFPRLSAAIRSHAKLKTASRATPYPSTLKDENTSTALDYHLAVVTIERLASGTIDAFHLWFYRLAAFNELAIGFFLGGWRTLREYPLLHTIHMMNRN